jgi:hypothetical protein
MARHSPTCPAKFSADRCTHLGLHTANGKLTNSPAQADTRRDEQRRKRRAFRTKRHEPTLSGTRLDESPLPHHKITRPQLRALFHSAGSIANEKLTSVEDATPQVRHDRGGARAKELFFASVEHKLMVAPVTTGEPFSASEPQALRSICSRTPLASGTPPTSPQPPSNPSSGGRPASIRFLPLG